MTMERFPGKSTGRPRMEEPREHILCLRVTTKELETVLSAKHATETIDSFLRSMVVNGLVTVPVVCSWCDTQIGSTVMTRISIMTLLPESEWDNPVSHGMCVTCRDTRAVA